MYILKNGSKCRVVHDNIRNHDRNEIAWYHAVWSI